LPKKIDINCDMGESFGNFKVGNDEAVMPYITSANVGCGFHGGDPVTMGRTVALAKQNGVGVGSHPALPDLMGFGRREMKITTEETRAYLLYQTGALKAFLETQGMKLQHVKPHGALYTVLMKNEDLTRSAAGAILDLDKNLYWFMPVPNRAAEVADSMGVKVVGEMYVDMDYGPDGGLVVRREQFMHQPDPKATAERLVRYLDSGKVKTTEGKELEISANSVSVHGDTVNAPAALRVMRAELKSHGVEVTSIRNIV